MGERGIVRMYEKKKNNFKVLRVGFNNGGEVSAYSF